MLYEVRMRNSSYFKNEASRSNYARIQSIWIEEAMVFLSYTLLDLAKKLKGKLEKRDQFGRDKLIDKGKKVVYIILQFKRLL